MTKMRAFVACDNVSSFREAAIMFFSWTTMLDKDTFCYNIR